MWLRMALALFHYLANASNITFFKVCFSQFHFSFFPGSSNYVKNLLTALYSTSFTSTSLTCLQMSLSLRFWSCTILLSFVYSMTHWTTFLSDPIIIISRWLCIVLIRFCCSRMRFVARGWFKHLLVIADRTPVLNFCRVVSTCSDAWSRYHLSFRK